MPRDIDPARSPRRGAEVIDVVAVRDRLTDATPHRRGHRAQRTEIVAEEVRARYVVHRRGDALAPLIKALRRHGVGVPSLPVYQHAE